MEQRRLGRTEHRSTVVALGGAALGNVDQPTADRAIGYAFEHGVNHVDVAPGYGEAEVRLAPWMPEYRRRIFLGCKTTERTREGAKAELHRSLERLGVDAFDLYQLHGVCWMDDLDAALAPGGAIEAFIEARDEGLIRHIGITGHELRVPEVHAEALRRFPFDTVMFPLNVRLYAEPQYRAAYETLMELVTEQDVGVHIIKAVAKAPWGDREPTHSTWYEPFTDPAQIDPAVAFALSQPVTTLCTAGDVDVMRTVIDAAERYTEADPEALDPDMDGYEVVFPSPLPSARPAGSPP